MAASERGGLLPIPSVTSPLMFLEGLQAERYVRILRNEHPHLDGQKEISKGTSQRSYPNYLSQLRILNQLHVLVYKTKSSKTKDSENFFPFLSDLMDFVLQLMENGVVMFLVNRSAMNRNTSPHTLPDHWQVRETCQPLGTWVLRRIWYLGVLWFGMREMPTARINTCHKKFRLSKLSDPNFSTSFFPFHFLGLKHIGTSVQRQVIYALNLLPSLISSFINC